MNRSSLSPYIAGCPSKLVSIRNTLNWNRNQFQHYTKKNVCFGVSIKPNLIFGLMKQTEKNWNRLSFGLKWQYFLLFRGHPTLVTSGRNCTLYSVHTVYSRFNSPCMKVEKDALCAYCSVLLLLIIACYTCRNNKHKRCFYITTFYLFLSSLFCGRAGAGRIYLTGRGK